MVCRTSSTVYDGLQHGISHFKCPKRFFIQVLSQQLDLRVMDCAGPILAAVPMGMEALIAMEDRFFHKSSFFFSYAFIP